MRTSSNMIKKRKLRYAMSMMLIFSLLFASVPFSSLMVADPLGPTDLSVAICAVRNLVQSAYNPEAFSHNFPQAVTALNRAAGITTRFTSDISIPFSQSLGPHLFSSPNGSLFFPNVWQLVLNQAPPLQSHISTPPLHPPTSALVFV